MYTQNVSVGKGSDEEEGSYLFVCYVQTVQPSRFRRDHPDIEANILGKHPESRLPLLMSRFLNSALLYIHVCFLLSCMSKRKRCCGGAAAIGDADTSETEP